MPITPRTDLRVTKIAQKHIDQLLAEWPPEAVHVVLERARQITIRNLHPQLGLSNIDAALVELALEFEMEQQKQRSRRMSLRLEPRPSLKPRKELIIIKTIKATSGVEKIKNEISKSSMLRQTPPSNQ